MPSIVTEVSATFVASTMRRTSPGSATPGSSIVSRNEPLRSSPTGERVGFARRPDFGVKITSGLRHGRIICRRSRKNICTGVAGTQTCML